MVGTSIFHALFLAPSVFRWGQVWIKAPYVTAMRVIIIESGRVTQQECVWGPSYSDSRRPVWFVRHFVWKSVIRSLSGNNESLLLAFNWSVRVIHRFVVWGRPADEEGTVSVSMTTAGPQLAEICSVPWWGELKERQRQRAYLSCIDVNAHTHTPTQHSVSTSQLSRFHRH